MIGCSLDSCMANMLSFKVSMVAMPMLTSPVSDASNTHCSRGSVAPCGVHEAMTSGLAAANTSGVKDGVQLESVKSPRLLSP